ncbi:HNH endonuclease [Agromyces sp. NPDC127015]|uniref:HNH endonuclease n=1 Tax=Agromyces sp. NPDC127015 TaxID=3347108 RepID=UPI00365B3270
MTGVSRKTRAEVRERDRDTCQMPDCGRPIRDDDYSLQHRRARGMGGSRRPDTNAPSNLVTVCGSATTGCHGYIESHPGIAAKLGFRVAQGVTPADVPIYTFTHGRVYLNDDGTHTKER